MASEAAKAVAREVQRAVENGGKPYITTIAPKKGYSPRTAHSGKIQKTKSYKAEMKPFLDALIAERNAALERMKVVRNKAKYRDLSDAVDKLNKNIQLASGGATEDIKFHWE